MRLISPKLLNSLLGILAFLFLLHVLTSVAMVFFPEVRNTFEKNTLTRYYKDYTALGPFFTVKSVMSTYYFGYSYKSSQWSQVAYPVTENHQKYLSSGSYTRLKRAEFEKFLAGSVYSEEEVNYNKYKAYLIEYINTEYLHQQTIDSVRVLVFRDSSYQRKIHTDTTRIISYQINR